MADEVKVLSYKMDGEYMVLSIDPNKNGVALAEFRIHYTEVPAELMSLIAKK